jgi:hypothetical protein
MKNTLTRLSAAFLLLGLQFFAGCSDELSEPTAPVQPSAPTVLEKSSSHFDTRIAFQSIRDGNYEIYVMNPDGSEQINLTNHPANDVRPSISPNGKKILFNSFRDRQLGDLRDERGWFRANQPDE